MALQTIAITPPTLPESASLHHGSTTLVKSIRSISSMGTYNMLNVYTAMLLDVANKVYSSVVERTMTQP